MAYAEHHLSRLPAVLAARLERLWGLRQPNVTMSGRWPTGQDIGVAMYYLLLVPAGAGLAVLRRRRAPVWVLIAPAIAVSVSALIGYGFLRLREPAEITLVIAAGVALDALASQPQPWTPGRWAQARLEPGTGAGV